MRFCTPAIIFVAFVVLLPDVNCMVRPPGQQQPIQTYYTTLRPDSSEITWTTTRPLQALAYHGHAMPPEQAAAFPHPFYYRGPPPVRIHHGVYKLGKDYLWRAIYGPEFRDRWVLTSATQVSTYSETHQLKKLLKDYHIESDRISKLPEGPRAIEEGLRRDLREELKHQVQAFYPELLVRIRGKAANPDEALAHQRIENHLENGAAAKIYSDSDVDKFVEWIRRGYPHWNMMKPELQYAARFAGITHAPA